MKMNDAGAVVLLIPSYEPGHDVLDLCTRLEEEGFRDIVFIDDGSGTEYREIFDEIESRHHFRILRHAVNLGKGRALKSGFNYVLNEFPDAAGAVTADSDGQHTPEDIRKCMKALAEHPDSLVLGCREFSGDGVPWKSRFGNELTKGVFSFLCGVRVSDTQTGLRGIPRAFMKRLMNVPGERFEFETNMLLEGKGEVGIVEVPIRTVYDSKENHKTHFNPLRDSAMIYRVILSYSLASVASAGVDFIVFAIANGMGVGIWGSTAVARVCSVAINFLLNKRLVFRAGGDGRWQLVGYVLLVIASGCLSALAISGLSAVLPIGVIWIKAFVETVLFFLNYHVQRRYIFVRR